MTLTPVLLQSAAAVGGEVGGLLSPVLYCQGCGLLSADRVQSSSQGLTQEKSCALADTQWLPVRDCDLAVGDCDLAVGDCDLAVRDCDLAAPGSCSGPRLVSSLLYPSLAELHTECSHRSLQTLNKRGGGLN